MAASVDVYEIKEEIVVFLRNKDILSVGTRGVTTQTDTGNYSNDSTDTLDTDPTLVKNVRSIVVGGSTLVFGTDYSINYDTGVITYVAAQTGAFTIQYDTGSTDRIFPDFPKGHLKLDKFPRIAVDIMGSTINEAGLGATKTRHDYDVTVVCYSKTQEELEDMISSVMNGIMDNKKDFFYSKFSTPTKLGPILNSPGKGEKVIQRNIDFRSMFNYESV